MGNRRTKNVSYSLFNNHEIYKWTNQPSYNLNVKITARYSNHIILNTWCGAEAIIF